MSKVIKSRGLFTDYIKELEKLAEFHSELFVLEMAYTRHITFLNAAYMGAGAPIADEYGQRLLKRIRYEFRTVKKYIRNLKLGADPVIPADSPKPPAAAPAPASTAVGPVVESAPPAVTPDSSPKP